MASAQELMIAALTTLILCAALFLHLWRKERAKRLDTVAQRNLLQTVLTTQSAILSSLAASPPRQPLLPASQSIPPKIDLVAISKHVLGVPGDARPILPDRLYLMEDRPIALDVRGAFPAVQSGDGVVVTAISETPAPDHFVLPSIGDQLVIDGRRMTGDVLISARKRVPDPGARGDVRLSKRIDLNVVRPAAVVGKSAILLTAGDSLVETGKTVYIRDIVASFGMNIECIGTLIMKDYTTALTTLGEARGGMTSGSFTGHETITGTATAAVRAEGNTGDGACAMADPSTTRGARQGVYKAVFTAPYSGLFEVEDPNGLVIGSGALGTPFFSQVCFTIKDGGMPFVAGDGFDINVVGIRTLHPIVSVEDYLSRDNEGRKTINPFMWPAPPDTPDDWQVDGKVFSVKQYCDAFDLPYPTHFFFNAVVNNAICHYRNMDVAEAEIVRDITIVGGMMARELPETHVGFGMDTIAYSLAGNHNFVARQRANLAALKAVRQLENKRKYLVPGNAFTTREVEFNLGGVPSKVLPETGIAARGVFDPTHPIDRNLKMFAGLAAAWIAGTTSDDSALMRALDRMPILPNGVVLHRLRRGFEELEDSGILAKLGGLHIFGLPTEAQALVNLIVEVLDATKIGLPIFASQRGWTFPGSMRLDLTVNPGAASPANGKMLQDSFHVGVFNVTDGAGWAIGNADISLAPRSTLGGVEGVTQFRSASRVTDTFSNLVPSAMGHHVLRRSGQNVSDYLHDAVVLNTIARASSPLSSQPLTAGFANGISGSTFGGQLGAVHYGDGTPTDEQFGVLSRFLRMMFVASGNIAQTPFRPLFTGATPAEGEAGVSRSPTFALDDFSFGYGSETLTHRSTDWEVRSQGDDVLVWSSTADKFALSSIALIGDPLPEGASVYLRARRRAGSGRVSEWSARRNFTTGGS